MAPSHRRIAELLASADTQPQTSPIDAASMADRARNVLRKRRRGRRLACGAVALLVMIAGVLAPRRPAESPLARDDAPTAGVSADAVRAEVLALREESRRREALVDRLLANERRRLAARELRYASAAPDVVARLHYEQDRAALVLIDQADRLSRDVRHREAAADGYRRIVELFPRSQWAAVARQRLDQLPG